MASVLDLVKHYQHAIEKYPNDEQKILKCIDKLFHLDVTVQHLQETGVGRTVNALRKEPGEVGQAARALVYKWKSMVAAEESDQEGDHDTKTYNGHGKDSDDYTKQHRIKQEQNVKPNISSVNVKTEDYKQMNGNHSGSKRKHQTNEEEKSTLKRSKYSSSSDNEDHKRKPDIQIKKELSDSESDDTDDSQSESDSEDSESSREEIKVKQEVKVEPTDKHRSSSSKHQSHSNYVEQKRDSSASKKSHESSDKHSSTHSHSSRSKEKYSPEKSSSKEKSQSTQRHESSKEKYDSFEKKQRTEHKSSHTEKEQKESKSSSKHSSSDKHKSSSRKSESSTEKHESNNDKHLSKSEKHKSHSHNSEKEKHKSSSEKEISTHKHKTKDSSVSNSSKDKHSSSSKDKSQDRSSSSKEKSSSHSEKKHSSSKDSKSHRSDNKSQSDKGEDKSSEKKSKHKSSSSSNKGSKSSTKSKEDEPKKKAKSNSEDSDDGIDCGSGASFAEALGMMLSPTKPKKKLLLKDSQSPNNSFSNDLSPAALLAPSAKLAPLPALEISALPEISPNYKPRPPPKLLAHLNDEDAMCASISSKNQRTKVYSGNKVLGKIPTLYEMCVQILQEHIDALEYTGGVPYEILKPVVDRATPQQLFLLEHYNPYLMEDTDHLWQKFCEKHFRNKHRQEMETCREMYIRCQEEQENRLKSLTANIRMTQEAKKAPIKQTKMAYVDSVVKPPRNVARKQAVHGTAHVASASPAARVASLATASNVLRTGRPAPTPTIGSALQKPKKAPLMAKALQLMRGRKR